MTVALQIIADVRAAGGSVEVLQPGKLRLAAPQPLPVRLVQLVKDHKPEIISALQSGPCIIHGQPHDQRVEWVAAYTLLCSTSRPDIYNQCRWQQLLDDAAKFINLWQGQAAGLHWQPQDVFSLSSGLLPLIEGGDILALCDKTAVIRSADRKSFNTCCLKIWPGKAALCWAVCLSWNEP